LVVWAALCGAFSAGCQSDAGAICEKLFDCKLLHDEAPSSDNPPGFSEDVCQSQVDNELSDGQQEQCAECVDSHGCGEISESCRSVCAAKF
jgi:hypothetical protein